MKACSKCKKELELIFFYKKQDKLSSQCKNCLSVTNKARYSDKHTEIKEKALLLLDLKKFIK